MTATSPSAKTPNHAPTLGNTALKGASDAGLHAALTLTTIRTLRLATFLPLWHPPGGGGRKLGQHPHLDNGRDVRSTTVHGHNRFPDHVDGGDLGEAEQLTIIYELDLLVLVTP